MLACANQKGGVGKTTTVVNLAAYLAGDGRRVLVVDLDPQGNATSGLGATRAGPGSSIYDALLGDVDLGSLIVATETAGLSLVRSSISLAGAEVELAGVPQRERRLSRVLAPVRAGFDDIFIDCPPSLGLLTVNGLTAADAVLIPMQCEYYALEGLSQLIATIHLVRDHLNPGLAVRGVVLTMFDARTNLSAEVAAEVRQHLGAAVFDTVIPRSVRLAEAPSHGRSIAAYAPESRGAAAYRALATELRNRVDGADRTQPGGPGDSSRAAGLRSSAGCAGGAPAPPNPPSRGFGRRRDGGSRVTARPARPASLGRGLSALIPQAASTTPVPAEIPIDRIERNPYQPRTVFEMGQLDELRASIETHGVLQPVLVTETLEGYRLIAGERRVRAAQLAGLTRIPAIVRQAAGRDQLELALVENVQRADLNALEEARAYRQLVDEFGLTHDEVAGRVGRARSTVANTIRLLELAPPTLEALGAGRISEGHARALLGLDPGRQADVIALIERRGLSVRQVEALARRLRESPGPGPVGRVAAVDGEMERVEEDLRRSLGTKVRLARSRKGGRIIIEWYGEDELGRLYERLTGGNS